MSNTEPNQVQTSNEDLTMNTTVTQQQPKPTEVSTSAQSETDIVAGITPYNAYLEIQTQVSQFERFAEDDQAVAITLPDYPFFTETKLQSIFIHQSGTISISGEAKGGKMVSVRDQVDSLSYALSVMSRPANPRHPGKIEVGFVS
jgi:hypothetical protein